MSDRLHVEVDERVATVTLNDPKRRNALDIALCDDISSAFDELEARDDVGAAIVTGAPPAFCAGADLSQLASPSPESLQAIYEGFLRVGRSPLPTVAAVNGPAVGAGMNLALVCDLRLAGASARFESRFLQLGVHPGGGHTWLLSRAIGSSAAQAMVMFGESLTAADAERHGLVWRAVGDDELLPCARELAARVASLPRGLVDRTTATFQAMATVTAHDEAVTRELEPQLWSFQQPAFQERLRALRERIAAAS
jgi:enoyl-CoA hydratase